MNRPRPQVQQLNAADRVEPLFLGVQAFDRSRAGRKFSADAGEIHHPRYARVRQRLRDGGADPVLRGTHVGRVVAPSDGNRSVRFERSLSTPSTAGGRALAMAGAGIFAAPQFALEEAVEAGRLTRLLTSLKLPEVALYAAWPERADPPSKTSAFVELAKGARREAWAEGI
ncbi:MAG TPA: LysR substrate-binding domain-containing protein [Rubrivivax sp.]|nr:LysR substrate-binding domain-containing protein [Rubrivivax sp.]